MPCQWLTKLSVVTSTLSSLLYSCSAGKEKENKSKTADLLESPCALGSSGITCTVPDLFIFVQKL